MVARRMSLAVPPATGASRVAATLIRLLTRDGALVCALVLLALIPRLCLAPGGSFLADIYDWMGWSAQLAAHGPRSFYAATNADYLPGYLYVLWLLHAPYIQFQHLLAYTRWDYPAFVIYKLPAMAADTAMTCLIFLAGSRWADRRVALLCAVLFALNPAIIDNSTRWGQVDSIPTLFMLLALICYLDRRMALAGALFALSVLVKPTALVLAPLLVVASLRGRRPRDLLALCVPAAITGAVLFLPFVPPGANPLRFALQRFEVAGGMYPVATYNAFNLWTLVQPRAGMVSDAGTIYGVSLHAWGWMLLGGLIAGACLFLFLTVARTEAGLPRILIPTSALLALGFFLFLTRMHERHLLPALSLLALSCALMPRLWPAYLWLSCSYVFNLTWSYGITVLIPNHIRPGGLLYPSHIEVLVLTAGNLAAFLYAAIAAISATRGRGTGRAVHPDARSLAASSYSWRSRS